MIIEKLQLSDRNLKKKYLRYFLTTPHYLKADLLHSVYNKKFSAVLLHVNANSQNKLLLICGEEVFEESTVHLHVSLYCISCPSHVPGHSKSHTEEVRYCVCCKYLLFSTIATPCHNKCTLENHYCECWHLDSTYWHESTQDAFLISL